MRLAWLAHAPLGCLFDMRPLAHGTKNPSKTNRSQTTKRVNNAIEYVTHNQLALKVPKLDVITVRVVSFLDASFANNANMSTKLRHFCFFCDDLDIQYLSASDPTKLEE